MRAQRALDWVNLVMAVLSALAIGLAGCVLTWEVIGRYFLSIPSDWQDELSVFLLVGATFGSASWIQAQRGHVSIDAVAVLLPPRAEHWRRIFADVLSLAFCAFFALKSWDLLMEAWVDDQTTSSAWGPPLWIPYGCMTVGMAMLSLQLLLQVLAGSPPRATHLPDGEGLLP
jgi:TRAP-type C4-dicarboxylate transport system permease small subunit